MRRIFFFFCSYLHGTHNTVLVFVCVRALLRQAVMALESGDFPPPIKKWMACVNSSLLFRSRSFVPEHTNMLLLSNKSDLQRRPPPCDDRYFNQSINRVVKQTKNQTESISRHITQTIQTQHTCTPMHAHVRTFIVHTWVRI